MGRLYSLIAWETLNGLDRAIFQLGWTTLAKLGMLAVLLTAPGVALVLTAIFWQPACRGWNRLWRRTPNPLSRMRGMTAVLGLPDEDDHGASHALQSFRLSCG